MQSLTIPDTMCAGSAPTPQAVAASPVDLTNDDLTQRDSLEQEVPASQPTTVARDAGECDDQALWGLGQTTATQPASARKRRSPAAKRRATAVEAVHSHNGLQSAAELAKFEELVGNYTKGKSL